jgi:nitrogen fixation protein FixH
MGNPIAGQTYTLSFETTETLTGSTVTIEYEKPNGEIVTALTPTSIDESSDPKVITYMIPDNVTTEGVWEFRVKIVTTDSKVYYSTNRVVVKFERKF